MIRKTLLALVLAAPPALAQQPAQQPAPKPASTMAARADTTKAKTHRGRAAHARPTKWKTARAPRETTTTTERARPGCWGGGVGWRAHGVGLEQFRRPLAVRHRRQRQRPRHLGHGLFEQLPQRAVARRIDPRGAVGEEQHGVIGAGVAVH